MTYSDFNHAIDTNLSGEVILPRAAFNNASQLYVVLNVTEAADGADAALDVTVHQSIDRGANWVSAPVISFVDAVTDTPREEVRNLNSDTPFGGDLKFAWVIEGGELHGVLTIDPAGANNSLDWTGKATLPTDDNDVSIAYADVGVNDTLTVEVDGHDIVFNLVKVAAVKAVLETALTGANNDLAFKAHLGGTAGNSIALIYANAAAASTTTVSHSGTTFTVALRNNSTPIKASYTTVLAGANNDMVFTAKTAGVAGNNTTIRYVDPAGNNAALSVGVVGTAITVNLATNGGGTITSTAALIKAAIEAAPTAAALVDVANSGADTGAGVVTALSVQSLAGGSVGTIAATADEVRLALQRYEAFSALATVDHKAANDGTGIVTALASTPLASGAAAAITTTGDAIKTALAANAAADALVGAADHAGNDGSGVVTAMSAAFLDNAVGNYVFTVQGFGK